MIVQELLSTANYIVSCFCSSANIVNICLKNMHTKACSLEYPGTTVKRFPVPPEFVDWKAAFPAYKPVDYTSEKVLGLPPWADPEIRYRVLLICDVKYTTPPSP